MVSVDEVVHARVFSGTAQPGPGNLDVVVNHLLPALAAIEGYRGADLLVYESVYMLITWWVSCPGPGGGFSIGDTVTQNVNTFDGILDSMPQHERYQRVLHQAMENGELQPPELSPLPPPID
jgi:hypothetical protein